MTDPEKAEKIFLTLCMYVFVQPCTNNVYNNFKKNKPIIKSLINLLKDKWNLLVKK